MSLAGHHLTFKTVSLWLSVAAVTSLPWLCLCPHTCPQCTRESPGPCISCLWLGRIWGSCGTALWCLTPRLWFCCVFGHRPVGITHCYPVTSSCSYPSQVKSTSTARYPWFVLPPEDTIAHAHERCKWRHERHASITTCTNASPERLPASSCSCSMACAP